MLQPIIAAEATLATGFACFTTHRDFDGDVKTPWRDAAERLERVLKERNIEPRAVFLAGQVHGTHVAHAENGSEPLARIPHCDGLVTARRGVFLVVRTADCLPLVLVDPDAGVCAALHAGWKGSLGNIVAEGIAAAEDLGARRDRMRMWIGPAITRENYEVSEDLIGQFRERYGHLGGFTAGRYLDLPELARLQAAHEGIPSKSISFCGLCTSGRETLFHSHRRQGTARGHQFTVCGFLP